MRQSTGTECQATWPNLKEKLRDVLSLDDADLTRMETELFSIGTTKIEDVEASAAGLRPGAGVARSMIDLYPSNMEHLEGENNWFDSLFGRGESATFERVPRQPSLLGSWSGHSAKS